MKYTYDSQNQLTKEEHYNGNGTATSNITKTYEYTYDTAGNILTEKVDGVLTKNYTYSTGQWTDKLLAFNGSVFSYDSNGNPLTYSNGVYSYSMLWEHGRQLASMQFEDGSVQSQVAFYYDADGIRTMKDVNGITHTYLTQNGRVVRETIGSGSTAKVLDFIYDESGKPCSLIYTNGTATPLVYYYVLNLQGDVVKIVNATGESRAEYTYNAWGEVLTATGIMAAINPLRYRGYYYDTETGFYYLQSRYYDPVTHRFINADSFASTGAGILGTNMFAYCNNNPIAYRDDSGEAIWPTTCVIEDGNPSYSGVSQRTWIKVPAEYDNGYFSDIESSIQSVDAKFGMMSAYVNNTDEQVVLDAKYLAFYNGVPVVKLPIGRNAFSFGIMFIGNDVDKRSNPIATIQHEYGHSVHFSLVGPVKYTKYVAIPSVAGYANHKENYYSQPWEYIADKLGGVEGRTYSSDADTNAALYWWISLLG